MSTDHYGSWRYLLSFSGISYAQTAFSAALTFLLVQFVSIETFADYRLGVVCMGIVTTVGFFGADRSLVTELARSSDPRATVVAYLLIRAGVALACLGAVWAFARLSGELSPQFVLVFGLAGALMALRSPGWFDHAGRLRQHAVILLTERILAFMLCGAVVLFWPEVTATYLGLVVFGTILTVLIAELAILEKHLGFFPAAFDRVGGVAKGLLRRQKWVWYLSLSSLMMTFLAQFVLYLRSADLELAYLGVAMQFAMISMLFMQQLARVRGPAIAKMTGTRLTRKRMLSELRRLLVPVFLSGVTLALLIGSLTSVVLLNFFERKYVPAIPVNWVLMAWVAILGAGFVINRFVIGMGLQAYVLLPSLVWGGLCLALVFLLSEAYGAVGYAWILLCTHAGSIFSQFWVLWRHTGLQPDDDGGPVGRPRTPERTARG